MVEVFKKDDDKLIKGQLGEINTWINIVNPTKDELEKLEKVIGLNRDFLYAALDPEVVSRIESDEEQVLIILNGSHEEYSKENNLVFKTVPLGVIIYDKYIATISIEELKAIKYFKEKTRKNFFVSKKTRFTIQIIERLATEYLTDLRRIDRKVDEVEQNLLSNMKNEYLLDLLEQEKNLVYFATAVKANENILKKIIRSNVLPKYHDDEDLLEDALIEMQQANETTNINLQIIRSIRDGFASIINNNSSTTMKFLASLTILLTVPTTIFSFFGMNTNLGVPMNNVITTFLILIVTIILIGILILIMKKEKML